MQMPSKCILALCERALFVLVNKDAEKSSKAAAGTFMMTKVARVISRAAPAREPRTMPAMAPLERP